MYEQDVNSTARGPNGSDAESGIQDKTRQAAGAAKDGAQEVAGTVKEQGREVAREARHQARTVVSDLRSSATQQARTQNQRLADGLRQASDQFGQMSPADGSPAGRIVAQLGDGGRRAADYLEDRGPEGLLDDVQEYARRKPGTFLLLAVAAGFAAGRLGRAAFAAAKDEKAGPPDAYRENNDGLYVSRSATEGYVDPSAPVAVPAYQPGVGR